MSHKVTIPGTRFEETFKKKQYLYNYLVRWLLKKANLQSAPAQPNRIPVL